MLGVQGHVAYPEKACNPIHTFAAALTELTAEVWDAGDDAFPPTSFQISSIHAGTGAGNVIPGKLDLQFNFRFGTVSRAEDLQARVAAILQRHEIDHTLEWSLSGEPFLTRDGPLQNAVNHVIETQLGITPRADTGGGTSDARFIAPLGAEVVELGPTNASIHKIDENIAVDELERLPALYEGIMLQLMASRESK